VRVTVRVHELSRLQKLLGVGRRATLGSIAAISPEPHSTVAIEAACGRFVDRYAVPPDAIDPAEVARRRRLALESLSGRYQPPELEAAQDAATD
jgi:hypothetical protein